REGKEGWNLFGVAKLLWHGAVTEQWCGSKVTKKPMPLERTGLRGGQSWGIGRGGSHAHVEDISGWRRKRGQSCRRDCQVTFLICQSKANEPIEHTSLHSGSLQTSTIRLKPWSYE